MIYNTFSFMEKVLWNAKGWNKKINIGKWG